MKKKSFIYFIISIVVVVLINVLARNFIFRVDLTEDQRYTISDATKKLLSSLDDDVFIKVHLDGDDMPAEFKRFRNTIEETLDEFQIYAKKPLRYRFSDPTAAESANDSLIANLSKQGIKPTSVVTNKDGQRAQKLLFPVATISYKGKKNNILLLKGDQRASRGNSSEILNQSLENIEYELASGLKSLITQKRKKVGFLVDNTVFKRMDVADMFLSLKKYYDVFPVTIEQSPTLDGLDALIIAKPNKKFSEASKYKMDQFVMNGGKALFFIDALDIREDSIRTQGITPAISYDHNLTDLFFRYGVRFNADYIEDLNCGLIDLIVGYTGNVPKMESLPWKPYPIVNNFFDHPTVKNLDALTTKYVSTLDTVKTNQKVNKIPLITTSPFTKVKPVLEGISYNDARQPPIQKDFKSGPKTIAFLLEGKFTSLYKSRILKDDPKAKSFKNESVDNKILICSDGDIISNAWDKKTGGYLPMGFDKITGVTFGNKKFLLNVLEYMLDDQGIILARNKEITLRPLDKTKIKTERSKWQLINLVLPILGIIIFGLVYAFIRKKKYT